MFFRQNEDVFLVMTVFCSLFAHFCIFLFSFYLIHLLLAGQDLSGYLVLYSLTDLCYSILIVYYFLFFVDVYMYTYSMPCCCIWCMHIFYVLVHGRQGIHCEGL